MDAELIMFWRININLSCLHKFSYQMHKGKALLVHCPYNLIWPGPDSIDYSLQFFLELPQEAKLFKEPPLPQKRAFNSSAKMKMDIPW